MGTINDLDQRLSALTDRKVDLKLVFPVALGVIGLHSTLRNGVGFSEVPAYILICYAFDSFWKFHSGVPARPSKGDTASPAPGDPSSQAAHGQSG
ncbi:MAG: hypothetical protein JO023_28665 [Chloroflexi bacterium]|nr:hypothetical protein [Chloroflexota bacterium]